MKYNVGMTNKIHPTALIGPHVELGSNNIIGPGAVVIGPCEIGDDNWIGPYAVIGTPGEYQGLQHPEAWQTGSGGFVKIGSGNTIREFVTVQVSAGTTTSIGSNCYFMTKSHVPHDAVIEDHVKVACAALIGGFCHIGRSAYIGLGAIIHQRLYVGEGAMVGMGSVVTKHVPPLSKFFGSPAKIMGFNEFKSKEFLLTDLDFDQFSMAYDKGELPSPNQLSESACELISRFYLHANGTN
jgi:UDP-N-acetylglucosamine acyltransferase